MEPSDDLDVTSLDAQEDSFENYVALQLPDDMIAQKWLPRRELVDPSKLGATVFGAQYQSDPSMELLKLARPVPLELLREFLSKDNKSRMFDPTDTSHVVLFLPLAVISKHGAEKIQLDLQYLCGAAPFADRVCVTPILQSPSVISYDRSSVQESFAQLIAASIVAELSKRILENQPRALKKVHLFFPLTVYTLRGKTAHSTTAPAGFPHEDTRVAQEVASRVRCLLRDKYCFYPRSLTCTSTMKGLREANIYGWGVTASFPESEG